MSGADLALAFTPMAVVSGEATALEAVASEEMKNVGGQVAKGEVQITEASVEASVEGGRPSSTGATPKAASPKQSASPELDPRGTGNNPILPGELVRHEITTKGRTVPTDVKNKIQETMQRQHPKLVDPLTGKVPREHYEIAHPPDRPFVMTMEGEHTKVFGQLKVLNQAEKWKIRTWANRIRIQNNELPQVLRVPIRPPKPYWGKKDK
jgi:hypothetical protein